MTLPLYVIVMLTPGAVQKGFLGMGQGKRHSPNESRGAMRKRAAGEEGL